MDENTLRGIGIVLLTAMALALAAAALLIGLTFYQLRRARLTPGMGFIATLHAVPLTLVVGLDLLDMALDVFSAPISWVLLSALNLQGLRLVTAVEALLPFTQFVPTLTLAWVAVRWLKIAPDDPRLQRLLGVTQLTPRGPYGQ